MKKKSSSATIQATNGLPKPKALSAASKNAMTKVPKAEIARKDAALDRLEVSPEQVRQCPPLSATFGQPGIVDQAIDALRFSDDPVATSFLAVYDAIPVGDRDQLLNSSLLLEAVAIKSGVNCNELLGAMIFSFRTAQAQKSGIMAMAEHPSVLRSTIWNSYLPAGVQDRKMLHEAVGFLPTPKGMSLNLNLSQAAEKKEESSPDVNDVFPMITDKQPGWQERRTRLLEAKN